MLGYLNSIEETAVNELKEQLQKALENNLCKIILYGSKARGDFNESSDIDLLVIVNKLSLSVSNLINTLAYDIELKYDLSISTHIRSIDYFDKQINNTINLFIKNAINNRINFEDK